MKSPENYPTQEHQAQKENAMSEAEMQKLGASILEDSVAGTENAAQESFEPAVDRLEESGFEEVQTESREEMRERIAVEDGEKLETVRRNLNWEESDSVPPEVPVDDGGNGDRWEGGDSNPGNQGSHTENNTTINNIYISENNERKARFKICEQCLGSGRRWARIPLIPCPVCDGRGKVSDLGLL